MQDQFKACNQILINILLNKYIKRSYAREIYAAIISLFILNANNSWITLKNKVRLKLLLICNDWSLKMNWNTVVSIQVNSLCIPHPADPGDPESPL